MKEEYKKYIGKSFQIKSKEIFTILGIQNHGWLELIRDSREDSWISSNTLKDCLNNIKSGHWRFIKNKTKNERNI